MGSMLPYIAAPWILWDTLHRFDSASHPYSYTVLYCIILPHLSLSHEQQSWALEVYHTKRLRFVKKTTLVHLQVNSRPTFFTRCLKHVALRPWLTPTGRTLRLRRLRRLRTSRHGSPWPHHIFVPMIPTPAVSRLMRCCTCSWTGHGPWGTQQVEAKRWALLKGEWCWMM